MKEEEFLDKLSSNVVSQLIDYYGRNNFLDGFEKKVADSRYHIDDNINEKFCKRFELLKEIIDHKLWFEQIVSPSIYYSLLFNVFKSEIEKEINAKVFIFDYSVSKEQDIIKQIVLKYKIIEPDNLYVKFKTYESLYTDYELNRLLRIIKLKGIFSDQKINLKLL